MSTQKESVRIPTSPYESWWNADALMNEAKRLAHLQIPQLNSHHVMRWRRKQVWLINLRIRELVKIRKKENTNV